MSTGKLQPVEGRTRATDRQLKDVTTTSGQLEVGTERVRLQAEPAAFPFDGRVTVPEHDCGEPAVARRRTGSDRVQPDGLTGRLPRKAVVRDAAGRLTNVGGECEEGVVLGRPCPVRWIREVPDLSEAGILVDENAVVDLENLPQGFLRNLEVTPIQTDCATIRRRCMR